jgi:hypothetical protein
MNDTIYEFKGYEKKFTGLKNKCVFTVKAGIVLC